MYIATICNYHYTHTHAVPTGAPEFVVTTDVTSDSIGIRWARVGCIVRNSEITGYTVQYGQAGSSDAFVELVSGTNESDRVFTATGLTPATSYFFQVAGVGSAGIGPFTSSIFVETERRCGV